MPYYESSRVTLIAADAIARASFVKLEADGLKACGAADTPIGFTELGAQNAGEHVCVRLINSQGTFEARSTGSIAIGSLVMLAEGGAVAPHSDGALAVGIALSPADNGDFLQIVPIFDRSAAAGA